MMTVQFNSIGKNGFSLNDITLTGMTAGYDDSDSDLIQVWDASSGGYSALYYYYVGDSEYKAGWYNASTEEYFDDETPEGFPVGTAFWYIARGTSGQGTQQTAGAVENDATVTYQLYKRPYGNYNLIASPYPMTLKLNEMTLVNMTAGNDDSDSDLIQFWDATSGGYSGLYYLYVGDSEYKAGWYNASSEEYFDDEWPTGMPVGTAFWYIARGEEGIGSITFSR